MGVLTRGNGMATVAALAVALAAPAAQAWEWPFFGSSDTPDVAPAPIDDRPVTFATGWYLRGDVAVAQDTPLQFGTSTLPQSTGFPNSWSIGLGFGYKFNDWFRTDVTADYRAPRTFQRNTASATCPVGPTTTSTTSASGVTTVTYGTQYSTCYDFVRARMTNFHVLFNVYADLGTWWSLTPYVGVGVGPNFVYQKVSRNWFTPNGASYNVTYQDPGTAAVYNYDWDQSSTSQRVNLAFAGMFGVSYALTPNTAVDMGYRFLYLGNVTTNNIYGVTSGQKETSHEIRVGLRYTPD